MYPHLYVCLLARANACVNLYNGMLLYIICILICYKCFFFLEFHESTPVCTSIISHVLRKLDLFSNYTNDLLLSLLFLFFSSLHTGMQTMTFPITKFIYPLYYTCMSVCKY